MALSSRPLVYYNEIDPFAAQWLRNLIAADLIAPGDVDTRSIVEVQPDDLAPYTQVHLFAGIGGWSYAARLAGIPDATPLWTGSCPCQPFSAAGKQRGHADQRHLWPEMRRLLAERRPAVAVGEQVASRLGREWLAGVRTDLEALGYAVGAADLCAAGVGAPHIRQRLYWVADSDAARIRMRPSPADRTIPASEEAGGGNGKNRTGKYKTDSAFSGSAVEWLADTDSHIRGEGWSPIQSGKGPRKAAAGPHAEPGRRGDDCGMGDTESTRLEIGDSARAMATGRAGPTVEQASALWADAIWLPCGDGKARRIKPGLEPLVTGLPPAVDGRGPISRIGALRGAGNAIVPQVAAAFLRARLSCTEIK